VPAPPLEDAGATLLQMLARPNLRSRRPIFRTYDHQVLDNTVFGPGFDAALLRVPGTNKGLALTTDGNPWYVALDPYAGTQAAVAEAARNIVCTGARPLAVTNCLNFGNPERPHVFWQLQESVRGLADACRAFELPVVSGNVSLYNETSGRNIPPTPVIGMVGLLEDLSLRCPAGFRQAGDLIFLLGDTREELGGTEYSRMLGSDGAQTVGHRSEATIAGQAPRVDLAAERGLHNAILEGIARGIVRSAHDVAEGGTLVALAEAALFTGLGVRCPALSSGASPAATYFGESQGRIIISVEPRRVPELRSILTSHHVPAQALGVVGGDELQAGPVRLSLDRVRQAWETPW
jgi:phosphoribosylformylglycinamidine synthase